jgi:putative copper resistance protein D
MFGAFVAVLALITRMRHWPWIIAAGVSAVGVGFWLWLPKLTIDAYPTTYMRSIVPYNALSIAHGLQLYGDHCAVCHGDEGYGDGPAAAGLRPRPADLTAKHTADHTAGDLFWWLTHGKPGTAMAGFQDRLSEEERWDLINVVRILSASEQARPLGPDIADNPRVVAPDFAYPTVLGDMRALKDFRGQASVLLVFFTHPDSLARLAQLRDFYPGLRQLGAEILAIPLGEDDARDDVVGGLSLPFTVVSDGWLEVSEAYTFFQRSLTAETAPGDDSRPRHLELLIDRQGYLRGRWSPGEELGWASSERLMATLEQLQREKLDAPSPDLHVH